MKTNIEESGNGTGTEGARRTFGEQRGASNVKVMHTRIWVGVVVQGAATGGSVHILAGEMVVPLQPMNSSSAECAFEALRRGGAVPILSLLSSRFALCCNCCTADKAASNGRFLKARAVLDAFVFHIGTFCRIHCLCTATSRCMKLDTVEDDVSGVVRFGLALRPTGTTKCVRYCLADVLM